MNNDINLPKSIEQFLPRFGIKTLRDGQKMILNALLNSKDDLFAVLKTGGGKTLCFQLASIYNRGLTIIIYPLLSLIADQERRFNSAGILAYTLKGGMKSAEIDKIFNDIKLNNCKVLLTGPEMISQVKIISLLKDIKISLLVIDEVHTVSQWGDTFRESFLLLNKVIKEIKPEKIAAFTATASQSTTHRIKEIIFENRIFREIRYSPDRENIFYNSILSLSRHHTVIELCKRLEKPILVFCPTRALCESTAIEIKKNLPNIDTTYYHAGIDKEKRKEIEGWYIKSKDAILVSTSAFGMGVDKGDIKNVIHLFPPKNSSEFIQESGRAGRNGQNASSYVIVSPFDENKKMENEEEHELIKLFLGKKDCIRKGLLTLMGEENCPPCKSGCNICTKEFNSKIEDEDVIVNAVYSANGKYRASQISEILTGYRGSSEAFYNCMKNWNPRHLEQAIKVLIDNKKINRTPDGRLYVKKFARKKFKIFTLQNFLNMVKNYFI